MSKYQLKLDNPSVDGTSGHHTVLVHILETDGEQQIKGVPEVYGIESTALELKFNGDINKWLQFVAKEMLDKHQRRQKAHHELIKLHGTVIDIEESS